VSTSANTASDPAGTAAERVVSGRYWISTLLGSGGMGVVWLARDEVLQRDVALKQLTNVQREDGSSAVREARAAARIKHPGVVQVHDVLPDEDGDCLVEAPPGRPLSAIIRERGRLPVDGDADRTASAVGIASSPRCRSGPRDIKPEMARSATEAGSC